MTENNGILKEATASKYFSKRVDDTEQRDKSVRERKENIVTKITIAGELNETLLEESPSGGSRREIKNPIKIGDMATTDKHRCQRPLRDIIGKREQRREELDKMEGDLRQRLDMLECSIPAVMIWNIWRTSQGSPVCRLKRILEKQFKDTRELACRSTPSCHYDCRIREVEAERKLALKKVEEARTLWSEKFATLEERKRKLDEARRIQEEQKNAVERLNEETRVLRETMKKKAMEMDELCQCDDTQCKQRHLSKVSSTMSLESGDIECLEKLQRLAEEEVIAKREILELERREEAYMRTLQQTDELWSKMEGDTISAASGLQEQLDMKIAANQQLANRVCELEDALEKCRARLAACRAELEKFRSIEKVDATIGRDDDVAKVADKEVAVRAKVVHRPIGRADDVATVKDDQVLARVEVADGEALARVEVVDGEAEARIVLTDADAETALIGDDKSVSVRPDMADLAVDRPVDLVRIEDAGIVVRPEDLAYEQQRFKEVREYLSKLDSLKELYKDDGKPCAPDFVCNDVVTSPTGMTDEELIALGVVEYTVPTRKPDETVSDRERDKQLQKELARKALDVVKDVEKKEEREDDTPGVKIEREVVEKMEKRVAEIVDVPVRETVTPRTIEEEVVDDRPVTMPRDRAPEVNKIEADRGIVIQRDTILSWIDAIDTIRTTAARHPDCREVKKDADILAEQVSTYVGVKPKEVAEENAALITEGKREKVIEKNEIKAKRNKNEHPINETKLQDKLIILKAEEMEPVRKIESVPVPNSEETSVEVNAPMEVTAESELQPTLTKEEVPIGMEPPMAVSMENSFRSPTIHKEDLKDDTVPLAVPEPYKPDIEKMRTEEIIRIKDIVQNTKENEIPKNKNAERHATVEDLTNNKLAVNSVANSKTINSDKETLVVPQIEKKEQEIKTSNHIERNEKETDKSREVMRGEITVENEKTDKVLAVTEIEENEFVEEIVEKTKEMPQLVETKKTDIKETPHMEMIRTNEIVQAPPVSEMKEVEQEILAINATEEKEIIPRAISPTVDIIEVGKFEPNKSTVDVEKDSTANSVEQKIKIQEPTPTLDVKEESLLPETEVEEIGEPVPIKEEIKAVESPLVTDTAKGNKIEVTELSLEDLEKKEKIEAEELLPVVTEESIDIIQPTPILPTIKREMEQEIEAAEEPVLKVEKEKDEEIEEGVTSIKLPEKKEVPPVEKKKIITRIPPSEEPTLRHEKEVPVEEKKAEVVQMESKITIAEIKSTEMEMPAIPLDPQLVAQYLIIAKFKEKELLQLIPAKKPCAECCLQPLIETAGPLDIPQTDVLQTEIVQAEVVETKTTQAKLVQNEVVQAEIVQTKAVETELVQIITQAVSTADAPPIQIISEYLKPVELKASRTEIAGDRPEITGRKMLWRKRLKDQSTVTTASTGSQTDKTSHVSHDRVVRDERERARVPTDELLRSIKIAAAGLVRPNTEREIRTINYGGRSEEVGRVACNCCLCGRTPTPPSTGPRLEIQPQIDAKTATPPAVAAFKRMFIRPKIDHPMPRDRLCPDCKAKIWGRMPRERDYVEKIISKISRDQGSCGCASSIGKSRRAVPHKRAIEKRDQACLAKIPKRKTNPAEQKRKDDMQSILEDSEKLAVQPLSPSCICFKLERTGVEPIRKGNCYCAD
ncbi:PREDICTED: titin-like [Vollenhovia emeryi]|uniref:titin-like n=1 Tax=Vollenhovia emeryi TaxID=411798 RepID=UPI0005F4F73C|nr:PREDICTED: titin-like [Vollenhovia emeryi]